MSIVHGEGQQWAQPVTDWKPHDECPCGCKVIGWKLTKALPGDEIRHVVGCVCRRHVGKRNNAKGRKGQARTHKALDGQGFTPYHEESGRFYDLTVRPEVKAGAQVPASFEKFISTDWFRRALSQSERSIPVGIDARPAVSVDGRWLVVDIRRKS